MVYRSKYIKYVRIENQDYYGHLELGESNLFIVCDGIGARTGRLNEPVFRERIA
jgi:serine/threonine protein phosphatase PrpC